MRVFSNLVGIADLSLGQMPRIHHLQNRGAVVEVAVHSLLLAHSLLLR